MADKNVLTPKGKEELEKRLEQLVNVEQPKAFEELNFARSQGDLSENSDYDAAREKTEHIKAEIAKIRNTLDHAVIIETPMDNSVVSVGGGKVIAERVDNGHRYEFYIVGAQEADPANGKISNNSPVAVALAGKKIGDTVEVNAKITYSLKIIAIED